MMIKTLAVAVLATVMSGAMAQVPEPTSPSAVHLPAGPAVSLDTTTHVLDAADANAWLDGFMPYALESSGIPGAVVVIVKDGKVLTSRGFGYADRDRQTPVDPASTLFRPGSVSKLLTWTAVMQQVEAGKIDLDADVNRYLDFRIPPRDGQPVTMRELMQHSAGFEEQSKGIISEDPKAPGYDVLLKQWVPSRIFAGGSTPAYSNYGASLAGYIVQRVSGETFDDYMDRHIFAPLAMSHSSFRQPLPARLDAAMSKGYQFGVDAPRPFEIIGPAPAGALSSSGEDMAHFMIAHLQQGAYAGQRILGEATAQTMHDSPLSVLPPLNRMELGFFETNINGREVIAHLGDTMAFHTSLHLFLKDGVGLYASFNSAGKAGMVGGVRAALFQRFSDRYFPAGMPDTRRVAPATAAEHAEQLAGRWDNSRTARSNFMAAVNLATQASVSVDAQHRLVTSFKGLDGAPLRWIETAPFVWQAEGSHERLAAKVVDGRPVRFSLDGVSPFMVFDRTPAGQNGAWLIPALAVSAGALLLTVLIWPTAALVRRHYRVQRSPVRPVRRAYLFSRLAALGIVLGLAAWATLFIAMFANLNLLNAALDSVLRSVQIAGIVAFVGGWLAMLYQAITVWAHATHWPARLWSIVLLLSATTVLWVAWTFHLLRVSVSY